jgi:hypothetical protein
MKTNLLYGLFCKAHRDLLFVYTMQQDMHVEKQQETRTMQLLLACSEQSRLLQNKKSISVNIIYSPSIAVGENIEMFTSLSSNYDFSNTATF